MLDILSITGPIYLSILLGLLATRNGIFTKNELQVLGKFVLKVALPALVFSSLAGRPITEIFNTTYLAAYLIASLISLIIGYYSSRYVLKENRLAATFNAMGVSCSNSGFIGFPILLLIVPDVAGVALALNVIVENLVMIPLLLIMAERSCSAGHAMLGKTLIGLTKNPLMIALITGTCVSVMEIPLPQAITRTVELFSRASGALSLFIIGGTLVGLSVRGMNHQIFPVALGKLLLHPITILATIWVLLKFGFPPLETDLHRAIIIMAAIPMMGTYTILAQAYGQERTASAIMLFTTMLSFFTLSGLLMVI
ncbi:permease [Vibrio albus]|uniref:Permease n=1 Tax=Vibrio albus TaxID=2200953 RepID=A0A2U3B9H0_9VIBR|nr:AEC family transporter [Vibrio albus]PWI33440.1 permease [Vibrio albus]